MHPRKRIPVLLLSLVTTLGISSLPGSAATAEASLPTRGSEVGVVSGVVRNAAAPVAGLTVAAFESGWNDRVAPVATAQTDATGRFALPLPPGHYKVVAEGADLGLLRRWWVRGFFYEEARGFRLDAGQELRTTFQVDPMSTLPKQPSRTLAPPRSPSGLAGVPVDRLVGYQPQAVCRGRAQPGTLALRRLLLQTYGPETIGVMRACGAGARSEHKDGRALDWMVNAHRPAEAARGDNFVRWATRSRDGELGAMARRLGVMYLIWRGKVWNQAYAAGGWREYRNCDDRNWSGRWQCHFDHVHISLNKPGARKLTSWWSGRAWRR